MYIMLEHMLLSTLRIGWRVSQWKVYYLHYALHIQPKYIAFFQYSTEAVSCLYRALFLRTTDVWLAFKLLCCKPHSDKSKWKNIVNRIDHHSFSLCYKSHWNKSKWNNCLQDWWSFIFLCCIPRWDKPKWSNRP